MNLELFIKSLSDCKQDFNALENCPYLYGTYGETVWCPITYLNFCINKHILSIDKVNMARDLLKLDEECYTRVVAASDGTGEEELKKQLCQLLKKSLNEQNTSVKQIAMK